MHLNFVIERTVAESTRAKVAHWIVRGGILRKPDGTTIPIDVDPVIIGRAAGATVQLADPEVSGLHCELRAASDGVMVKDLGSTNGTLVGSMRVGEGIVTAPSDLRVGNSSFEIIPNADRRKVDVGFSDRFGGLAGTSPRMRRIFSVLERIAKTELSVLILGETGTGKEVVAKSIHDGSDRHDKPFIVVDCGSIPPNLAESLLFGHEKGAFTGASERRKGALSEADGGTLFLDELGELPLDLQPKLLRALAEQQVRRVGASTFDKIDVRVLAATRRDLNIEVNQGRFRSDLFFRVAQVIIEMPPLRERMGDLSLLVEKLCERVGRGSSAAVVAPWLEKRFAGYDWPGNVRELSNVVSVAAALAHDPEALEEVLTLSRGGLSGELSRSEPAHGDAQAASFTEAKRATVASFERDYFTRLYESATGNISEMARQSGMERHHVRAFLRKYAIVTK